jgi:hypothetical protein
MWPLSYQKKRKQIENCKLEILLSRYDIYYNSTVI